MGWLDARKVRQKLKLASKVSQVIERELVVGINFDGYLRKLVREQIVEPAQIAIAETWRRNASTTEQAVLEREAALGVLACATIDDASILIGGQEILPRSIVAITNEMIQVDVQAAEAAGNMGRAISVKYSNVPNDALSQLIAAWGVAMNIDHPDFRSVIFRSKTLENWGTFRPVVGGTLTGMGRSSYKVMHNKAVSRIADMPAQNRQLALQAIERIANDKREVVPLCWTD